MRHIYEHEAIRYLGNFTSFIILKLCDRVQLCMFISYSLYDVFQNVAPRKTYVRINVGENVKQKAPQVQDEHSPEQVTNDDFLSTFTYCPKI